MPLGHHPLRRLFAILALALATFAAGATAAGPLANWNRTVTLTPAGGHILGNPQARIKLVEYVSYTCPHCSHFEIQSEGPLRLGYVANGSTSVEVRHLVRDPVDLVVALLSNCGPRERFFANHAAYMRGQAQWIQPMLNPSEAQRTRWSTGDKLTRMRAIASDFRLYEVLEGHGYSRPQLDHCLADEAMAKRLAAQGADSASLGIDSTPSFLLNGVLLGGTHSWETLEPQLKARL